MNVTVEVSTAGLYPSQRDALFNDDALTVVECSSGVGASTAATFWACDQAFRRSRNVLWVELTAPRARSAFRRFRARMPSGALAKSAEREITFANGSRVWFHSANEDRQVHGHDVALIFNHADRARTEDLVRWTFYSVCSRWLWRKELTVNPPGHATVRTIPVRDAVAAGVMSAEVVEHARFVLPANAFREIYVGA
jgi:hypothetical protein